MLKKLKQLPVVARLVYGTFIIVVTTLKYWGDIKRHSGHDAHDQSCNCFSSCTPCIIAAARNK